MDKIDNSNLVVKLFEYKKSLGIDDVDIERQVTYHMNLFNCDETGKNISQKNIINSLTEKLTPFTYNASVKELLENVNNEIKEKDLYYRMEDLFRTLENANQGMVYSGTMRLILDIMNETNEHVQKSKILSELKLHDWIQPVKQFLFEYTTDPRERQNISSDGGKADPVYTIVEKVEKDGEKGFLTFIGDKWFYIGEQIEFAVPSDYINDREKLQKINLMQAALENGIIDNEKIIFNIDEDINIELSLNNNDIFISGDKLDENANLSSIFDSPIVPYLRKDMYPMISETFKNKDKIVDLDIVQRLSNITNPFLEAFAINYKDKMYVYSVDERYGRKLYEYESATMLVNEMKNELGYDLSDFYKDKFTGEAKIKKELEDKEAFVTDKITEITENIEKLEVCGLMEVSEEIKNAYTVLVEEKKKLDEELFAIKSTISSRNDKHIH